MANSGDRTKKRVQIAEERNTYHSLDDMDETVAAVKSLLQFEEASDVKRAELKTEYDQQKQCRKKNEQIIQLYEKSNNIRQKNIKLGNSFMCELIDTLDNNRKSFRSISSNLHECRIQLKSINENKKDVQNECSLNNLSLKKYQEHLDRKLNNQNTKINTINNEIAIESRQSKDSISNLSKQIHETQSHLAENKLLQQNIIEQCAELERNHGVLKGQLITNRNSIGDTSLDIEEITLKRDDLVSEIKAFEELYQLEMVNLTTKNLSLSERTDEKTECINRLEAAIQDENFTWANLTSIKTKSEEDIKDLLGNINKAKIIFGERSDHKNVLLDSNKVEMDINQKYLQDSIDLLEAERSLKNSAEQVLKPLKENEQNSKTTLEEIKTIINESNINIAQLNKSSEGIWHDKMIMEESVVRLKANILENSNKTREINTKMAAETRLMEDDTNLIQSKLKEIVKTMNSEAAEFEVNYKNLKDNCAMELEEIHNKCKTAEIELSNLNNELIKKYDESKQMTKSLENNLDGIQRECNVISEKVRRNKSLRDEALNRRIVQASQVRKRSIDCMSDSSDDHPNILEILKRKKEIQLRKQAANNMRNN